MNRTQTSCLVQWFWVLFCFFWPFIFFFVVTVYFDRDWLWHPFLQYCTTRSARPPLDLSVAPNHSQWDQLEAITASPQTPEAQRRLQGLFCWPSPPCLFFLYSAVQLTVVLARRRRKKWQRQCVLGVVLHGVLWYYHQRFCVFTLIVNIIVSLSSKLRQKPTCFVWDCLGGYSRARCVYFCKDWVKWLFFSTATDGGLLVGCVVFSLSQRVNVKSWMKSTEL